MQGGNSVQHPMILISTGRIAGNLSMQRQQSALYGECLSLAGGAGVLSGGSDAACLAARCDGLLLAGGGDLHPARYGQPVQHSGLSIDPVRDEEEQALFHAFFGRGKPVLGICRGMQAVNVFLGGTLRQHIEGHSGCCHRVRCIPRLAALAGAAPTVNSYHHQAVDVLAPSLHAAAWADDGTVEAVIHETAPLLGVQWHPERMVPPLCDDAAGENHLALFCWLCEHC